MNHPLNKICRGIVIAACFSSSLTAAPVTQTPLREAGTDPVSVELAQSVAGLRLELAVAEFISRYQSSIALRRVRYATVDHELAPAYLFTPVRMDAGKKYPGLVFIRGSGHGQFGTRYFRLINEAVGRGYVVILPDIRGSIGYGLDYYKKADVAGKQVDDVLGAADFLLEHTPVDPARLAIMGYSHGGLMTLLAIEKAPDRFAAAVDVVGPANLSAYVARRTSPAARAELFAQPSLAGAEQDPDILVQKSPIAHVAKIRTPLLIIAASNDTIVPVSMHQSPLIAALEAAKVKHEYQLYENPPGGHEFFPDADTQVCRDALSRAFDFLDKAVNSGSVRR
jgi:dipeptidyl aminopeptidase/acylaminoacyl peptidase